MSDDDSDLARDIVHVTQRLNQALGAEIQYQQAGDDRDRLGALAELEGVRDDLDGILEDFYSE